MKIDLHKKAKSMFKRRTKYIIVQKRFPNKIDKKFVVSPRLTQNRVSGNN